MNNIPTMAPNMESEVMSSAVSGLRFAALAKAIEIMYIKYITPQLLDNKRNIFFITVKDFMILPPEV